jgi:hypothetical protein
MIGGRNERKILNTPNDSNEQFYDRMKGVHQKVIDRLVSARWLDSAQILETKGMEVLRWREDGIMKIRAVHALLSELDYFYEGFMPAHFKVGI